MSKKDPILPLQQLVKSLNKQEYLLIRKNLVLFSGNRNNASLELLKLLKNDKRQKITSKQIAYKLYKDEKKGIKTTISMDKQYRTKNGSEVRIYALDGSDPFFVHGAIKEDGFWYSRTTGEYHSLEEVLQMLLLWIQRVFVPFPVYESFGLCRQIIAEGVLLCNKPHLRLWQ